MKKYIMFALLIFGINTFAANFNDGKYEVTHKKNDYTLTMKIIVKNSKILFIDFDKVDNNGVKYSTSSSEFRNLKEEIKKNIIDNQSLDNLPKNTTKEIKELLDFIFEKNKNANPGNYQIDK